MVQTATGSQVGYIPFLLGGGNSALVGMYGMASDSLVSARVVTATKGLVTASPEENEALFYALKGAGQFYGVVTEVTVKIFPLVEEIWSWTCIFLPHQIEDVAKVLKEMVDEVEPESGGMAAVTLPPGPPGNTKVCFPRCEDGDDMLTRVAHHPRLSYAFQIGVRSRKSNAAPPRHQTHQPNQETHPLR